MSQGRKIIFKCVTGSHLYGTSLPTSDQDFQGVFLPSTEDLLGLQNCPTEWAMNEDGVDCKFYSLPRFFELAAQGQPGQLELLFAPVHQWLICTPEWLEIMASRDLFVTQNGVKPFIGFALAQAHKSTIKGANLNVIRGLMSALKSVKVGEPVQRYFALPEFFKYFDAGLIKTSVNEFGFEVLEVAGRKYDVNLKTKIFVENLEKLEKKYGERSEAAAELGTDFKSLMHAERLIGQAEEFLTTGKMTFPRPDAEELRLIRTGVHSRMDWHQYLQDRITEIRNIESVLPAQSDRSKLNRLCQSMLLKHLSEESV